MFRRHLRFITFLAALSLVAGYLISNISLIGRLAMHLKPYRQYSFLTTWWKAFLLVFCMLMLSFVLQGLISRRLSKVQAGMVHVMALILAGLGLYYTFLDFQYYYAHRWLHEKFHLGGYLFWFGWMSISLYFLFGNKKFEVKKVPED